MSRRETASEIEDVATAWATRAQRDLTIDEREELNRWLDGDSRRLGAFVRAQAVWIHAERAAALGEMPDHEAVTPSEAGPVEPPASSFLTRRHFLGGGGAIAASVIVATAIGWRRYHTLESGLGETRHIVLAGGTLLTLDTDTQVDIESGSDDRSLILRRGKLFIEALAKGKSPISLGVGNLLMETTRGAFSAQSLIDEPIIALVTTGILAVSQSAGNFEPTRRLSVAEGQTLVVDPQRKMSARDLHPLAATKIAQLLAWRDGMLSFGGEALGDAVRAFDRYSAARIVVDSGLARERVTGLFKADDPQGFAMAVAASFGAVVNVRNEVIRLSLKKVPST